MTAQEIAEGLKSSVGVIFAAAAIIAAKVFPSALVPRELSFLEDLGTILGAVTIVAVLILRFIKSRPSPRLARAALVVLLCCVVVVVIVRVNRFYCYEKYSQDKHDCHLVGFRVSKDGQEMIKNVESRIGTSHDMKDLLDLVGLHYIPTIYGWSFTLLRNLYALAYLALLSSLVLWLGITLSPGAANDSEAGPANRN